MTSPDSSQVSTRRLADQLVVLNRVARIMSDITDLPGALARALKEAATLFPRRDIAVWLRDAEVVSLSRVSFRGAGQALPACERTTFPIAGDRLLEKLMAGGEAQSWNEDLGRADSGFFDYLLGEGNYHCLTLVPLLAHVRCMGVLMVASRAEQSVCEGEEAELVRAMAFQLAGATEAATLFAELRQTNTVLAEQKAFLQTVVDVAPGPIFIKDRDGRLILANWAVGELYGKPSAELIGCMDEDLGIDPDTAREWRAVNQQVMASGQSFCHQEQPIPAEPLKDRWFQTVIAPFVDLHGEVQGVIGALSDISERVRAEQHLARANEELQRLAQQDGLTGLANRRQLNRVLEQEWRRLRRLGASLALCMLDVDHFKSYNDRQGHLAGDDCLRQVARVIDEVLHRPADVAGRFGGEEFLLILPNTDHDGVLAVARGILRAVAGLAIPHPGSPLGRITVSLGVAAMVPDDASPERLIDAADQALYRAKAGGRNQVAVASVVD